MATCDKNILDIPVSAAVPANTDVIIITDASGVSTIRTWATVLGGITPTDIYFQVGVTVGSYPAAGATSYTFAALIGKRIRVFRQGIKQPTVDPGGGYFYTFNNSTGEISPSPAFAADEQWSIEIY